MSPRFAFQFDMIKIYKRTLAFLLSAVFVLSAPIQALGGSKPVSDEKARQITQEILAEESANPQLQLTHRRISREQIKSALQKASQSAPAEYVKNIGHTFLFVLTLFGVSAVVEKLKATHGDLHVLAPGELEKTAQEVSHQLINDGKFWSGLLSATTNTAFTVPVVRAMGDLFSETKLKPYLEGALKYGIVQTVSMVGTWEFGSELWTDATLLLENPQDQARAKELMGLSAGTFRALVGSTATSDASDRKLVHQLLTNMMYIVFLDSELRSVWFNRTWRTHLMKGEFVSYLSAMTAGGAIGSTIPAFGTLIGLVCGVSAMAVLPRERVHELTLALQDIRRRSLDLSFGFKNLQLDEKSKLPFVEFQKVLESRQKTRSAYVTILFEQLYVVFNAAQTSKKPVDLKQVQLLIQDALDRMQNFYANEKSQLGSLEQRLGPQISSSNRSALQSEIQRIDTLQLFFANFALEVRPRVETLAKKSGTDESLWISISQNYFQSFNEDHLMKLWELHLTTADRLAN